MTKIDSKQALKALVRDAASYLASHQKTVQRIEESVEAGVTTASYVEYTDGDIARPRIGIVSDETLRLDPELHQRYLALQDAQLALHRTWVQIAEYAVKVTEPKK